MSDWAQHNRGISSNLTAIVGRGYIQGQVWWSISEGVWFGGIGIQVEGIAFQVFKLVGFGSAIIFQLQVIEVDRQHQEQWLNKFYIFNMQRFNLRISW